MSLRVVLTLCAAVWMHTALADDASAPIPGSAEAIAPPPASPAAAPDLIEQFQSIEMGEPQKMGLPIDLTSDQDDLWERVRRGFSMPNLDNELVRRHQVWYMNRPEYLRRVIERSRPYMHHIIEEIEKRGLPTELALLPIVESSYNPMALSRARASGLWQFIPSTGKSYRLDQTWWIDERRDIVASTDAALDYLKYIYELHGDWQLALASYNWGEGAVGRAIAKNRAKGLPTDYSSLKMPRETQNYVPKLQALKNILANPALWAMLDVPEFPNKPYFSTIPKPADMDVKVAARLAEMPISEFMALNPAHNRPLIKANIPILLPADKVDTFLSNLDDHDDPLSTWQSYTYQKSDRLDKVAARFGISLALLKSVNGLKGRKASVRPGQLLLVPSRSSGAIDLAGYQVPVLEPDRPLKARKAKTTRSKGKAQVKGGRATKATGSAKPTGTTFYTVKKGDTLNGIAGKFKIQVRDIAKRNRVKAGIKPGQKLLITTSS